MLCECYFTHEGVQMFGRRPVFVATTLVYTLFQLGCALAPNMQASATPERSQGTFIDGRTIDSACFAILGRHLRSSAHHQLGRRRR